MSTEEILGLIQGLAGVVKTNQVAQHDACLETSQQIAQLSQAVAELTAKTQSASLSSATPRLPQLSLPEFDKEENLDRFLDQLRAILVSSGIPPNLWLLYLKQQCRKDARSYDLISEHEQHADAPRSTPNMKTIRSGLKNASRRCIANVESLRTNVSNNCSPFTIR